MNAYAESSADLATMNLARAQYDKKLLEAEHTASQRNDDSFAKVAEAFRHTTDERSEAKPALKKASYLGYASSTLANFAERVEKLPALSSAEQKEADKIANEIATSIAHMHAVSDYNAERINDWKMLTATRKAEPIEDQGTTHLFVKRKDAVEKLYRDGLKLFPGKEEAFQYTVHTAIDNARFDEMNHHFHPDVVTALPDAIQHMARHTRLQHYGHNEKATGQASLWAEDVAQSRNAANGIQR